jgi:hypothetical protein
MSREALVQPERLRRSKAEARSAPTSACSPASRTTPASARRLGSTDPSLVGSSSLVAQGDSSAQLGERVRHPRGTRRARSFRCGTDRLRRRDCCFDRSTGRPLAGPVQAPAVGGLSLARGSTRQPRDLIRTKAQAAERSRSREQRPRRRPQLGESTRAASRAATHAPVAERWSARLWGMTPIRLSKQKARC